MKDFLQVVSFKLLLTCKTQQLAIAIKANAFKELVYTLEQYNKIFRALVQQSNTRSPIYATLAKRSSLLGNLLGYLCPYKETRAEKHPQPLIECSILELATNSFCTKKIDLYLTSNKLQAIRDRLANRAYDKLCGQIKRRG